MRAFEKVLWCCAVGVLVTGAAVASAPVYLSGVAAGFGVLAVAFFGAEASS